MLNKTIADVFPHNVKEVALLVGLKENTVVKRIRARKKIFGVSVKFIRDSTKPGSPYRIAKESFLKLQQRILCD